MNITGKSTYVDLEGGFWGIQTDTDNYFPIDMPEQLKTEACTVRCSIVILEEVMTMQNWGIVCRIVSFNTT